MIYDCFGDICLPVYGLLAVRCSREALQQYTQLREDVDTSIFYILAKSLYRCRCVSYAVLPVFSLVKVELLILCMYIHTVREDVGCSNAQLVY